MRLASSCALIAVASGAARADVRDAFGLGKPVQERPLDCSDGLDFGCAGATDPMASDAAPFAISTWLPAVYLLSLPTANATHDAVAGYVTGVGRDDAGLSVAGGNGLENRWTVDGAPADNIQTGGADTKVPLTFLDGILVQTGGFAARDRASTGGTVDARLKTGGDHLEVDVRAWGSWTGEARQPPAVPNTYQLRTGTLDPGPGATVSLVADGPLPGWLATIPGARTWFVAGVAPSVDVTRLGLDAQALVDADGDGLPDGVPGLPETTSIETSRQNLAEYAVPAMVRVGADGPVQHLALTAVGTLSSASRFVYNATPQAGAVDQTNYVGDVIATYRYQQPDTTLRLQAAWHRNLQRESARYPDSADAPQQLTAYVPATLPDDPVLAAKCAPSPSDPSFVQCPIPLGWFESGGPGELTNLTADRLTFTADLAHRLGRHALRAGATVEDSQLVSDSSFTGGEQDLSLIPGENDVRRFISQTQECSSDIEVPCPYVNVSELSYRTLYSAAYVEDTWQPAPAIQVDGGLRWELMWVGPAIHFSDQLAPRLGASWDFLGGGRSRAWVSMGRSFALLPAGLGSTVLVGDRYADELTYQGATTRTVFTGAPQSVMDGIEPVTQDELTAGVEVALNRIVRARTYLQGRWLHDGIESTADGFGNPGLLPDEAPAIRQTRLFAVELSTALGAASAVRVGWAWGATYGNWTGAYNPRDGAALYNSADFDVTSENQGGPLPTTPGQRVYVDGERHVKLGPVTLMAATRVTLQSGPPRDVMADGPDGLVYLLPRGAAGYGPMLSQVDLRLGATYRHFDVTLDVFNIFDRRSATNQQTVYSSDAVHPIDGGTYEDLVFLVNDNGQPAQRITSYAVATEYQAPISAVLGIHRAF